MSAHPKNVGRVPSRGGSTEGAKESGSRVVPLGEVVDFNPRFGKDELADDSLASFIPMRCVEEESGRFEPLGDRKVADVRKGYTPFRDGDVIFAKVTPCMENGKAAVLKGLTNGVGFGSTEFFALRPKNGLEAKYLFHFILQSNFRRDAARNMTGAVGLRRVPKSYLEQQPIQLQPPDEQRRIVAEIEKQFTRLEAGVAALRRVQANLKRYRAAVLKAACEGRLVPTEAGLRRTADYADSTDMKVRKSAVKTSAFESGETLLARILTERRQNWQGRGKYKEPTAPDTAKHPPLPEGWVWANVEQLGDVQLGRQRSPKNVSKNYPTKYIRAANITERGIDVSDVLDMEFSPAESDRFTLRDGDIVLSEASGSPSHVGKPAVWRGELPLCCFQNNVLRLRPVGLGSKYTLLVFQHFYVNSVFAKVAGGVGINHLGAEKFSVIPFPLPPLAEQTRIVAEVERRLSVVVELEAVVSANLQRATRLRQSILQRAFEGELCDR
jgi:type I restriction enzyme S subunit